MFLIRSLLRVTARSMASSSVPPDSVDPCLSIERRAETQPVPKQTVVVLTRGSRARRSALDTLLYLVLDEDFTSKHIRRRQCDAGFDLKPAG